MKTVPPGPTTEETLLFRWDRRRLVHWRLAGLVGLALLVHAIGFYLFQVTYTPTGSQSAPSVQVTMLPLDRPGVPLETRDQARALAHWLAVVDPSLATEPPPPGGGPGELVEYVPSYEAAPPPFKPLDPPMTGSAPPPRPRPPGPVPIPLAAHPAHPHPADMMATTRVTLTGGIAALGPKGLPPVNLTLPTGAKTLSSTVLLIGMRPEGGAPYLFRESSSGEVAADDFARDYLSRLSFQPPPNGAVIWGWAEFHWGREVYR